MAYITEVSGVVTGVHLMPGRDAFTLYLKDQELSYWVEADGIHLQDVDALTWLNVSYQVFLNFFIEESVVEHKIIKAKLFLDSGHYMSATRSEFHSEKAS